MSKINIKFNNKNYSIDPASLADATSKFEAHLISMIGGSEVLEGDGQEFHKLAPTALMFRSTAPLDELQEVQINGVTIDPSNYTTKEGSTIITLPIEYLKTFGADNYEISVVSDSKSVSGGFSVVEPELNEYGFYYNQPYVGYVSYYDQIWVFFLREDGTMDVMILTEDYSETCSYEMDGNNITVNGATGTFTGSVGATEIYCNEVATNFVLGDEFIVADEDYIYIYREDLDGYEARVIDKTKASYSLVKSNINGKPLVSLSHFMFEMNPNITVLPQFPADWMMSTKIAMGEGMFYGCSNLREAIIPNTFTQLPFMLFKNCRNLEKVVIPKTIIGVGNEVFADCTSLTTIIYEGTIEQYNSTFYYNTDKTDEMSIFYNVPATEVICSDGTVAL